MRGPNECPTCGYRFPSEADLARHLEEGSGCPEEVPRENPLPRRGGAR